MLLEARQELQGARHAGASRAEWAATLESDMAALHSIINARIDRLTAAVLHVGAHTIVLGIVWSGSCVGLSFVL